MAAVMFYDQPVLLNRESHKGKKIAASGSFEFASKANSLYLAGVVLIEVCKEYPIVFTQIGPGKVVPVAILGLREGENLFVGADCKWGESQFDGKGNNTPFLQSALDFLNRYQVVFRPGELSWIYAYLVLLSKINLLVDKLADAKRSLAATALAAHTVSQTST